MQDNNVYKKRIVKIVAGIVLIFVVLPVTIFLVSIITRSDNEESTPITSPLSPIRFENKYQLDYSIGNALSNKVVDSAILEVLKESEINSAPHDNDPGYLSDTTYEVVIEETSFKKILNQPPTVYSFNISVSDGRTYSVSVYTYKDPYYSQDPSNYKNPTISEYYLAVIFKRSDIINKNSSTYIYYKDEENLSTLSEWAKAIDPTSIVVLKEKLLLTV